MKWPQYHKITFYMLCIVMWLFEFELDTITGQMTVPKTGLSCRVFNTARFFPKEQNVPALNRDKLCCFWDSLPRFPITFLLFNFSFYQVTQGFVSEKERRKLGLIWVITALQLRLPSKKLLITSWLPGQTGGPAKGGFELNATDFVVSGDTFRRFYEHGLADEDASHQVRRGRRRCRR
jgi:hypothetical protein